MALRHAATSETGAPPLFADGPLAQLRRKLEAEPARPRWLHTVPGVGYRLRRTEEGEAAGAAPLP